MSNIYIITLAVALLSCTKVSERMPVNREITIAVDKTQNNLVFPDPNNILELSGIVEDKWSSTRIHLTRVSGTDLNQLKSFTLPVGNRWLDNEDQRDRQIRDFSTHVAIELHELFAPDTIRISESSVFNALTRSLHITLRGASVSKHIIFCSDLMEHQPGIISFYTPETFALLTENPKAIIQTLQENCTVQLTDLSGIQVYLVYAPQNYQESIRYRIASKFFSDYLTSKGASVFIQHPQQSFKF